MMLFILYMASPSAQSYREFDRGRRAAAHAIIKSGKGENALSPSGERGIVRASSDLAPAGATTQNATTSHIEITIEQCVTTEVETADPRAARRGRAHGHREMRHRDAPIR